MAFTTRLALLCAMACLLLTCAPTADTRPARSEQNDVLVPVRLRLSLGGSTPETLVVTWATVGDTMPAQVCVQWKLADAAAASWTRYGNPSMVTLRGDSATAGGDCVSSSNGASTPFRDPGTSTVTQVVHSLSLTGLPASAPMRYRVGCVAAGPAPAPPRWSRWVSTVAPRNGVVRADAVPGKGGAEDGHGIIDNRRHGNANASNPNPTRLLVFGDMGLYNAPARPDMMDEARRGVEQGQGFDAALHVGDLAYDLHAGNGSRGDHFLAAMEPLAASVPYMVAPGNHEAGPANFSHYRALFRMPGHEVTEGLHYSFDVGLAHVLVYNTEVFFWPAWFRTDHMRRMADWMERDLATAVAARARVPWIIVVGHRPMYCAEPAAGGSGCRPEGEASRRGLPSFCPHNNPLACRPLPGNSSFPIEPLFRRYGVDLAVYGHVHDYERFHPVYDYLSAPRNEAGAERSDAPPQHIALTPGTTMHVTAGGAGNVEMRRGDCLPPQGPCRPGATWCAFQSGYRPAGCQSADHSYARVTMVNATHLHWVQQSHTFGRAVDDWWLVAEHHA